MQVFRLLVIVLSLSFALNANAASLLAVCDDNQTPENCSVNKISFPIYKTASDGKVHFKYKVDKGGLGDIDDETAFNSTVEVLDLWEAESNLEFEQSGSGRFNSNITVDNYDPILNASSSLGFSPIVFDEDGSIVDDILGDGAKDNVLGFAGAAFFTVNDDGTVANIKESQSLFNGFLFKGGNSAVVINDFQTTILHEFAHMFGIDHTQGGNIEGFNNGDNDLTDIPVMFPIAANPLVELQHDDIAAVRLAYPLGDEVSLYGAINGKLLKNGVPISGANIVAFKADDSNARKKSVACPSDVDGQGRGKFLLANLEPGEYILRAEPIDEAFTEGSSVGIHDPIDSGRMNTGFYQGDGQAILETSNLNTGIDQALRITINAGSTVDVQFDIGDNPASGTTNGEATFSLGGKALNMGTFLPTHKKTSSKIKITNLNPGNAMHLQISTDYPALISFSKNIINTTKPSKKLIVTFASYAKFTETFPELEDDEKFIPLRVEDLDTGYVDESQGFIVY